MQPSVWIFGTSASIIRGYATLLSEYLPGYLVRNWSIGNQTSVMGLMRLHQCYSSIDAGDFVVWEYPLLDMLQEWSRDPHDITQAFREACALIAAKGARLVTVAVAPRAYITGDKDFRPREIILRSTTEMVGGTYLDIRGDFAAAGFRFAAEQAEQYSDDRHIRPASPANALLAGRLADTVRRAERCDRLPVRVAIPSSWLGQRARTRGRSV